MYIDIYIYIAIYVGSWRLGIFDIDQGIDDLESEKAQQAEDAKGPEKEAVPNEPEKESPLRFNKHIMHLKVKKIHQHDVKSYSTWNNFGMVFHQKESVKLLYKLACYFSISLVFDQQLVTFQYCIIMHHPLRRMLRRWKSQCPFRVLMLAASILLRTASERCLLQG